MNILGYGSKETEKICTDIKYAKKKLPKKVVDSLYKLLLQLELDDNLSELATIGGRNVHELNNNRKGQIAIRIDKKYRLIIEPKQDEVDINSLNWLVKCNEIKSIIIEEVSNHYA